MQNVSKTTTIINKSGLHAHPASDFVECSSKFSSKIFISGPSGEEVNAKSIVMLLSLGLSKGESIAIWAKGEDEVNAVNTLTSLLNQHLAKVKLRFL
ncbi:MAG: HPr family phosphocarrier protein [Angelakisella sp.]|nr:HPr family phosphocarrier protein [Angelakisella sp.]